MSGYLRWLATQALGQSSGVRPARRLPLFAEVPAADSFAHTPPMVETPSESSRPGAVRTPAPEPGVATELPRAQHVEAAALTQPQDAARDVVTHAVSDTPPPFAQPVERVLAEPLPVDAARTRMAADDPVGDEFALEQSSRLFSEPHREPAALGTSAARNLTRPGRRMAAERPAAPMPAASPPPDVHIHIGRVELTALTPPAPARRESNAKKPMSLDEYLRRRGGRDH